MCHYHENVVSYHASSPPGRAQFENAIQADTPDEFNGRPARYRKIYIFYL